MNSKTLSLICIAVAALVCFLCLPVVSMTFDVDTIYVNLPEGLEVGVPVDSWNHTMTVHKTMSLSYYLFRIGYEKTTVE